MKKYLLLLSIGMLSGFCALSQSSSIPGIPQRSLPPPGSPGNQNPEPSLPRFDLNFPGGTPKELVKAIEKASGKPLNAIIPEEDADLKLPPISVKSVNVQELFQALQAASTKLENYITGYSYSGYAKMPTYNQHQTYYAFRTDGAINEHSIWGFYWSKAPLPPSSSVEIVTPPPVCRFYQLSPYLDAGYKVEDITTAIRTGWDMLGETNAPKMSYHKDTKLLIAVGEEYKLNLIGQVLAGLETPPVRQVMISSPPPASGPRPLPKRNTEEHLAVPKDN